MDFAPTEWMEGIADLAAQLFSDHATSERIAAAEDTESGVDDTTWKALAEAGLLGVGLPEEAGGMGGMLEICALLEQVGRHVVPAPVFPTLVLGALPLARFGSAEQQDLLAEVVGGTAMLTAALHEPESRVPAQPRTTAAPDGDGWRVSGTKTAVPLGPNAKWMLVPAAAGGVGLFLVRPGAEGVTLERQVGTDRLPRWRLTMQRAAAEVLVPPSEGAAALAWWIPRVHLALAAMSLGVSRAALDLTATYARERHQFGQPIGAFQAVRQRAADAYIDVSAMNLTLHSAAWQLDQGRDANREVRIARWWANEGAHRVVHAAQHLHGGMGYDCDYPLFRTFLWAKQLEFTLGGAPAQLAALGKLLAQNRSVLG